MRLRPVNLALLALSTAAVTLSTALPASAVTTVTTGPSTTTAPYVLPVADGTSITSLFTVADAGKADNGYEMVGIPDGLGAYSFGGGTTALMNHELRPDRGIVRRHGTTGAFVSKLALGADGRVTEGSDFINPGVRFWNYVTNSYGTAPVAPEDYVRTQASDHMPQFSRFCSGYLSEPGQLLTGPGKDGNGEGSARARGAKGKIGYNGQIYFANEETGNEGRVFGVTLDGQATQLPRLGLFSWENTIVAPNDSRTTVVMGNEDSGTGEIWAYTGTKQKDGAPVDQAGLTNGRNHVVKVPGATTDAAFRAAYPVGTKAPFSLQDIEWDQSGAKQNAEAVAEGGLALNRIEDGAFNPANKNEYFFVTTEGGDKTPAATGSRDGGGLWKLTYVDVEQPQLGGTLELVLDGSQTWGDGIRTNKPDNMTIDRAGNLLIQEDPGGNDHIARILSYRIADGARGVVARFDPALFGATNPAGVTPDTRAVLTTDEESSGIIQLADGSYLFDAQVHTPKGLDNPVAQVERGQLLKMTVPSFSTVYSAQP